VYRTANAATYNRLLTLFHFPVRLVFAAEGAEFLEFQPFRRGLLIFSARVVLALALVALESNDFPRHNVTPESR
jgi:hypothetical protein